MHCVFEVQVASAALQTVSNITEKNAQRVSHQAQCCAFKAAQAAETGISQLSKTIAELVAATADQAAYLTQRQASLVAAFAQEQAAKAAEALGKFTPDADLHQINDSVIQPDVTIAVEPSALETQATASHSSSASCKDGPHGSVAAAPLEAEDAEDSQNVAAACEPSNTAMNLAGIALADAEVRLLVKQVTGDIFRNVERAAVHTSWRPCTISCSRARRSWHQPRSTPQQLHHVMLGESS